MGRRNEGTQVLRVKEGNEEPRALARRRDRHLEANEPAVVDFPGLRLADRSPRWAAAVPVGPVAVGREATDNSVGDRSFILFFLEGSPATSCM